MIQDIKKQVKKLRPLVLSANYYLGNYKDVIWLFGDGRSGTTWVSDIINWQHRYREMFEPFHPRVGDVFRDYSVFQYMRPDADDPQFTQIMSEIFTGAIQNEWMDNENRRLIYKGLLIKDIFSNLYAAWVHQHLPHVKKVLLIRNPFSVAISKQKKQDWFWMTDPVKFLSQRHLYEDYLEPFEDIIRNVSNDYIERQILIWAIVHYVPLKQFSKNQLYILFYESIYQDPVLEIPILFDYLHGQNGSQIDQRLLSRLHVPSRVSVEKNNFGKGRFPVSRWKTQLSSRQIDRGLEILEHFGLDQIYGDGSMPAKHVVERLLMS